MQMLNKADNNVVDDIQGLIVIKRSPRGRRLKRPIVLEIPDSLTQGEKAVRRYVIDALCWKMPALIHFTFRNETVLKVATHLYRHTTGSDATLYQYTYGIHAFFKGLGRAPDILVKECMKDKSTDKIVELIDSFLRH